MKEAVLGALGSLCALGYLVGLWLGRPGLKLVVKPVPALCLAAWVGFGGTYARCVAAGLVLSALGDFLLDLPGRFVHGLVAFLLAHLLYIAAFLSDTTALHPLRALPFALYGLAMVAFLWPGLGSMKLPVFVYMLAICSMLWRASARVGSAGAPSEWLGLGGAVIFAASDSLIALDRFRAPIAGVRYPIILLYWLGQLGIAASALPRFR